jgi:hypothetical protein
VGTFTEEELRTKLLGFIRMVSRKQLTTLERGESVFQSGDPADRFYILASGELAVDTKGVGAKRWLEQPRGRMQVLTTAPRRPALPTGTRGDARGQRQARAAR